MVLKVFVLVTFVFAAVVFAESPLQSNQDEDKFGPYEHAGWRPEGPAFRLPEQSPLTSTFRSSQPQIQVDLTYGTPQERQETSEINNQNEKRLEGPNTGAKVDLTYRPPQARYSNQPEREYYVSRTNVPLNQPIPAFAFPRANLKEQQRQRENQVDLTYRLPQETLSVPPNKPAGTYGPPTVESDSIIPRNSETLDKEYQDQEDVQQQKAGQNSQVDLSYGLPQEGSGNGNIQDQQDLKYLVSHPNGSLNQPHVAYDITKIKSNEEKGGIEYQVDLTYGAPQQTLSVPPNQPAVTYGPPEEETTTAQTEFTTTELPTTTDTVTEQNSEDSNKSSESDEKNEIQKQNLKKDVEGVNREQSVYYIYHPSGLLQRVVYSAEDDQTNMAYRARLKYENVEPIQGPVYTYDPQTFVFKRLY